MSIGLHDEKNLLCIMAAAFEVKKEIRTK